MLFCTRGSAASCPRGSHAHWEPESARWKTSAAGRQEAHGVGNCMRVVRKSIVAYGSWGPGTISDGTRNNRVDAWFDQTRDIRASTSGKAFEPALRGERNAPQLQQVGSFYMLLLFQHGHTINWLLVNATGALPAEMKWN